MWEVICKGYRYEEVSSRRERLEVLMTPTLKMLQGMKERWNIFIGQIYCIGM